MKSKRQKIVDSFDENYFCEEKIHEKYVLDKIFPGSKCLEIGTWMGGFAEKIRERNPSELHLVDPWSMQENQEEQYGSAPDETQEKIYQRVKSIFSPENNGNTRVEIHRDISENLCSAFPENYFDFIYVDGDHTYEGVKKDLEGWWPKLKPGGWICGDDYAPRNSENWGVIEAVNEFVEKLGYSMLNQKQLEFFMNIQPQHSRIYVDMSSFNFGIMGAQFHLRKNLE